jgi:oxygen-independent coproporphyrinogen-3 oxidase
LLVSFTIFDRDAGTGCSGIGIRLQCCLEVALTQLETLEAEGLLTLAPDQLTLAPLGRLFVRNVAMVFDRYLPRQSAQGFSKAV